jgi:hypothetical protein
MSICLEARDIVDAAESLSIALKSRTHTRPSCCVNMDKLK